MTPFFLCPGFFAQAHSDSIHHCIPHSIPHSPSPSQSSSSTTQFASHCHTCTSALLHPPASLPHLLACLCMLPGRQPRQPCPSDISASTYLTLTAQQTATTGIADNPAHHRPLARSAPALMAGRPGGRAVGRVTRICKDRSRELTTNAQEDWSDGRGSGVTGSDRLPEDAVDRAGLGRDW
ncbi:hypothetical protein F4780DRAFT_728768 [Xylariomycetidae sp. FL0641]|nr:hypothetical protein F4780DRAFT_728768 [Xylariomycetidae sp. FL0641]